MNTDITTPDMITTKSSIVSTIPDIITTTSDIITTPEPESSSETITTMTTMKEIIQSVCNTSPEPSINNKTESKTDSKAEIAMILMNMPSSTSPEIITTSGNTSGTSSNSILQKVEELYTYVKLTLGSQKINAASIMTITSNLMQIVEKYNDLTGNQKKMLVIDTIKRIINETINDESDRLNLLLIADITLPTVIDTLVSAINGDLKFDLKKVKNTFQKIFFCCNKN
jgi:hypothetical protein